MSIGLIVTLIVLIAVVLSLAVDNDDRADRTSAPAAPLSYYVDGSGDGLVGGGYDQGSVPALKSHTGEFQGEGRMNTTGGLSVNRPMGYYHPFGREGLINGFNAGDVLSPEEQARLAHDEMLFKEWNDPLGWQAIPEQPAVMSYQDMLYLEQNGVYDDRSLAAVPTAPTVNSYDRIRFLEINTNLPGASDDTAPASRSDRQRFTDF